MAKNWYQDGEPRAFNNRKKKFGKFNIVKSLNSTITAYTVTNFVFGEEDSTESGTLTNLINRTRTSGDTEYLWNLIKIDDLHPYGKLNIFTERNEESNTFTTDDATALFASADVINFTAKRDITKVGGKDRIVLFSPIELEKQGLPNLSFDIVGQKTFINSDENDIWKYNTYNDKSTNTLIYNDGDKKFYTFINSSSEDIAGTLTFSLANIDVGDSDIDLTKVSQVYIQYLNDTKYLVINAKNDNGNYRVYIFNYYDTDNYQYVDSTDEMVITVLEDTFRLNSVIGKDNIIYTWLYNSNHLWRFNSDGSLIDLTELNDNILLLEETADNLVINKPLGERELYISQSIVRGTEYVSINSTILDNNLVERFTNENRVISSSAYGNDAIHTQTSFVNDNNQIISVYGGGVVVNDSNTLLESAVDYTEEWTNEKTELYSGIRYLDNTLMLFQGEIQTDTKFILTDMVGNKLGEQDIDLQIDNRLASPALLTNDDVWVGTATGTEFNLKYNIINPDFYNNTYQGPQTQGLWLASILADDDELVAIADETDAFNTNLFYKFRPGFFAWDEIELVSTASPRGIIKLLNGNFLIFYKSGQWEIVEQDGTYVDNGSVSNLLTINAAINLDDGNVLLGQNNGRWTLTDQNLTEISVGQLSSNLNIHDINYLVNDTNDVISIYKKDDLTTYKNFSLFEKSIIFNNSFKLLDKDLKDVYIIGNSFLAKIDYELDYDNIKDYINYSDSLDINNDYFLNFKNWEYKNKSLYLGGTSLKKNFEVADDDNFFGVYFSKINLETLNFSQITSKITPTFNNVKYDAIINLNKDIEFGNHDLSFMSNNTFLQTYITEDSLGENTYNVGIFREDGSIDDRSIPTTEELESQDLIKNQPIYLATNVSGHPQMDATFQGYRYKVERIDFAKWQNKDKIFVGNKFLLDAIIQGINTKYIDITFDAFCNFNKLQILGSNDLPLPFIFSETYLQNERSFNDDWNPVLGYPIVNGTEIKWEFWQATTWRYYEEYKNSVGISWRNQSYTIYEGLGSEIFVLSSLNGVRESMIQDAFYRGYANFNIFSNFTDDFIGSFLGRTVGSTDHNSPQQGYGLDLSDLTFSKQTVTGSVIIRRWEQTLALKQQDFFNLTSGIPGISGFNSVMYQSDPQNNAKIDIGTDALKQIKNGILNGTYQWNGTNFDQSFSSNNGGALQTVIKNTDPRKWDKNNAADRSYAFLVPATLDKIKDSISNLDGGINQNIVQYKTVDVTKGLFFPGKINVPDPDNWFTYMPQKVYESAEEAKSAGLYVNSYENGTTNDPSNSNKPKMRIEIDTNPQLVNRFILDAFGGQYISIEEKDENLNIAINKDGKEVETQVYKSANIEKTPNEAVEDFVQGI